MNYIFSISSLHQMLRRHSTPSLLMLLVHLKDYNFHLQLIFFSTLKTKLILSHLIWAVPLSVPSIFAMSPLIFALSPSILPPPPSILPPAPSPSICAQLIFDQFLVIPSSYQLDEEEEEEEPTR